MGIPRKTSLIQLVATSEEQVDNVYRPLQSMVRSGPLDEIMKTGEQFVRLPENGKIEAVTSSAMSRLGNPINFANFDESGILHGSEQDGPGSADDAAWPGWYEWPVD